MKDCGDYYEYLATKIDDILIFGKDPMATIKEICKIYILKGFGAPEYYLGGNADNLDEQWSEGVTTALSAWTYIRNVVKKLEQLLGGEFRVYKTLMEENHHPVTDTTPLVSSYLWTSCAY